VFGYVALRLPLPGAVVTRFVTDFWIHSNREQGRMKVRVGGVVIATPRERWLARMTQLLSGGGCGVADR
jgi:hypothetical protein